MPYVQKLHYIFNLISVCGDFESATNQNTRTFSFSALIFVLKNSKIPKTRNMAKWKLQIVMVAPHAQSGDTRESGPALQLSVMHFIFILDSSVISFLAAKLVSGSSFGSYGPLFPSNDGQFRLFFSSIQFDSHRGQSHRASPWGLNEQPQIDQHMWVLKSASNEPNEINVSKHAAWLRGSSHHSTSRHDRKKEK